MFLDFLIGGWPAFIAYASQPPQPPLEKTMSMNQLPYRVTMYNEDGDRTSECSFPTEQAGKKRFKKCVVSAECANTDRITFEEVRYHPPRRGGFRSRTGAGITRAMLDEWKRTPEFQIEGYVVHSVRTLNEATTCLPVNRVFHEDEADAIAQAVKLAKKWSKGHEGLVVFKAVAHVRRGSGVIVRDLK